jgi:hypothetical protein
MAVTLKRTFTAFVLTFVLLASMFGWTMRMQAAMPQHQANVGSSHQIARLIYPVCPPPPYAC